MIHAFVLIAAEPAKITELGPQLAAVDGVTEAHSVAGSEVALVAKLSVQTHEDVATAVTEHILQLPGVHSSQTLISFRQYGDQELDAVFGDMS